MAEHASFTDFLQLKVIFVFINASGLYWCNLAKECFTVNAQNITGLVYSLIKQNLNAQISTLVTFGSFL